MSQVAQRETEMGKLFSYKLIDRFPFRHAFEYIDLSASHVSITISIAFSAESLR